MKALHLSATALLLLAAAAFAHEEACAYAGTGFAPGQPDAPDYRKYAPDRLVDIKHLVLDVTPNFTNRSVRGTAKWTFTPIATPLSELKLDAVALTVESVTGSQTVAANQLTAEQLIITFAQPIPPGEEASVTIRYSGFPQRGLYFRTPELGFKPEDSHIWTQGEPDEARHWFPCYDYPNEKFTCEITAHVPTDMVVLSNGRKVSEEDDENGLRAVRWLQDKPMANYLIALVAGRLKSIEDKHGNVSMRFWTPASEIANATNSFVDTKPSMEFLEREIGVPYPWDKYDQVCIQDYHWGGMENTSLTTLNINTLFPATYGRLRSSQGLIAHELAHQWFGDLITCKDWSHIWLNEGFATYYELLFTEHKQGEDEFRYRLWEGLRALVAQTNTAKSIVWRKYGSPNEQFDSFAYGKGSFVLHMLREQLGPEMFRRCINTFVERHKFGTVVTDDLVAVFEELSGRSFDRFFDQWVYHGGFPQLDVDYSWDEKSKLARITVQQTQRISEDVALFQFPLPVQFHTKSGVTNLQIGVSQKEEDFYFRLPGQPTRVRIDPRLSVLAKVNSRPTSTMLDAMLADTNDVVGRLIACEDLQKKKDSDSVQKLKNTLNSDPYWGVRIAASKALKTIHTDSAFEALTNSMKQADERVRKQVINDVTGFFRPAAGDIALSVIKREKNPDIVGVALRSLDATASKDARKVMLNHLESSSWREHLLETTFQAMRAANDPAFIDPIRRTLADRGTQLPTKVLSTGLDALAYLAREQENRDAVRELIAGHVNHPREPIRVAAIGALGSLEDPRALPILERFAGAHKDKPETAAAERAAESIRSRRKPSVEVGELRRELIELQKQTRELKKEFEGLKARGDAQAK